MVITTVPHLDIRDWLQRLELLEYEESLKKFMGVEELINLNESDIKELGVKNSAHRARMMASLVALKGRKFSISLTTFWNLKDFDFT
jgi:Fic family protein